MNDLDAGFFLLIVALLVLVLMWLFLFLESLDRSVGSPLSTFKNTKIGKEGYGPDTPITQKTNYSNYRAIPSAPPPSRELRDWLKQHKHLEGMIFQAELEFFAKINTGDLVQYKQELIGFGTLEYEKVVEHRANNTPQRPIVKSQKFHNKLSIVLEKELSDNFCRILISMPNSTPAWFSPLGWTTIVSSNENKNDN